MQVTLINGNKVDSSDIVFHFDALDNGTAPVFVLSSTGAILDNQLRVADMDSMFSGEGWTYDRWNAWRAAHPYAPGAGTPFVNQDNVPGTDIVENLVTQNWLDTAANYYLDTFDTPAKKIGSVVVAVVAVVIVVQLLKSAD